MRQQPGMNTPSASRNPEQETTMPRAERARLERMLNTLRVHQCDAQGGARAVRAHAKHA